MMSSMAEPSPADELFRTRRVEEIRQIHGHLRKQSANHASELRTRIGEKHSEVVALATVVADLHKRVSDQEHLLEHVSEPRKLPELGKLHLSVLSSGPRLELQWGRLVALCDRFLAQKRLAFAARVLYIAESAQNSAGGSDLGPDISKELASRRQYLDHVVQRWISQDDGVTQDIYHAALIWRRIAPTQLVNEVVACRRVQIEAALATGHLSEAIAAIDTALFVISQLAGDLCRLRLSRRRLGDMTEFAASMPRTLTGDLRAFPDECYLDGRQCTPDDLSVSLGEAGTPGIDALGISSTLARAMQRSFDGVPSAIAACREFSGLVSRARDSSDPPQLQRVVEAATDAVSARLRVLVPSEARNAVNEASDDSKWSLGIIDLNKELRQLETRASPQVAIVDAALGHRVGELSRSCVHDLSTHVAASYAEKRADVVNGALASFQAAVSAVSVLTALDAGFAASGGSVASAPTNVYEQVAAYIIDERWNPETTPCGDPRGALFMLCRAMDATLGPELWNEALLNVLRPRAVAKLREQYPTLAEAAQKLLEGSDGDRSRLLLQPLVP